MTPFFRCAECGDHVKATEYGECAYCGGDVEIIDGEAQMRERPILFSVPMVRAILEGRKTMTRRVIKPQPDLSTLKESYRDLEFEFRRMPVLGPTHAPPEWGFCAKYDKPNCVPIYGYKCPYGTIGDRLWVRETWAPHPQDPTTVFYRATVDTEPGIRVWDGPWKPSIFMPRHASRITLEITDIRVEQVRDISAQDCIAEGMHFSLNQDPCDMADQARNAFHALWDSINAKRGFGWDVNPWVWAISFRRLK